MKTPQLIWSTIVIISLSLLTSVHAQRVWQGDDKDGGDGLWSRNVDGVTNWLPNWWPTATTGQNQNALFLISGQLSASTANVSLATGFAAQTQRIGVGKGKSVVLTMANGSTLTTASWWQVGTADGTGVGSANLTIQTSGENNSEVVAGYFHIGSSNDTGGGNSLTFSGTNLSVKDSGTSLTVVGRVSNNNTLAVNGGADVERYSLAHGYAGTSLSGNSTLVTGNGSRLAITNLLQLGSFAEANQNSVRVSDHAVMEVSGSITVGNSTGSNAGGNYIEISDGGVVKSQGNLNVYHSSTNAHGRNYVRVQQGGALHLGADMLNSGLMQIESGASVVGRKIDGDPYQATVQVASGGIVEARGSGLSSSVDIEFLSGSTLRISLGEETIAGVLDLNNTINMQSGSRYEVKIYSDGQIDKINFVTGTLNLVGDVILDIVLDNYIPVIGESWSLFTGNTEALTGSGFDLSGLDGSKWDLAQFNQDGNWTITAIPEPRATLALFFGVLVLTIFVRKQRLN